MKYLLSSGAAAAAVLFMLTSPSAKAQSKTKEPTLDKDGNLLWSSKGPCAKEGWLSGCRPLHLLETRGLQRYSSRPDAEPSRRISLQKTDQGSVLTPEVRAVLGKEGIKLSDSKSVREYKVLGSEAAVVIDASNGTALFLLQPGAGEPLSRRSIMFVPRYGICDPTCDPLKLECCTGRMNLPVSPIPNTLLQQISSRNRLPK